MTSRAIFLGAVLLAAGCGDEAGRPFTRREPAPHPDVVRELDAEAACTARTLALRNNSREVWTKVRISIDEVAGKGGFVHELAALQPREGVRLAPELFTGRNDKTERATKFACDTLNVHADTPRGPAHWYGSYQ